MASIETVTGPDYGPEAAGGGTPREVLCLHCSTGSSRQWHSLADSLGEGYRVIAPNLLGYGDNAPWRPGRELRLETEIRGLLPLISAPRGPVDVVAHSFGAAVAVKLALTHPGKVRSLTLYEPVLFGLLTEDDPAAFHEIAVFSGRVRRALSAGDTDTAARHFIDFWSGGGTWKRMAEAHREGVRGRIEKVRADFGALLADGTTPSDLESLDVPVLCLSGSRSPAATRRIADILAEMLPDARPHRFEDAGHMGPLTHPAQVNATIATFLKFPFARRARPVPHTPFSARAA